MNGARGIEAALPGSRRQHDDQATRPAAPPEPRRGAAPARRWSRLVAAVAATAALVAAIFLTGCSAIPRNTVPGCGEAQRLAIIAQSVPSASYVPCIAPAGLPPGWRATAFDPASGGTNFLLQSDRNPGRPVRVSLTAGCAFARATPEPARAPGVRTYLWYDSISPRFTGTLYDVFPGGCVTYSFDFVQGPDHIALMEQWEAAVGLYPRQQLRLDLRNKLGVELDP